MIVREALLRLIRSEYALFPKAYLQDYYKILYQACHGAEHAVNSLDGVARSLISEWNLLIPSFETPFINDISLDRPLVRLNLARCKADRIPIEKIAQAFFRGAKIIKPLKKTEFATYVELLRDCLRESVQSIDPGESDRFFDEIAIRDYPVVHHSEIYRTLYNPHYRVIPGSALTLLS